MVGRGVRERVRLRPRPTVQSGFGSFAWGSVGQRRLTVTAAASSKCSVSAAISITVYMLSVAGRTRIIFRDELTPCAHSHGREQPWGGGTVPSGAGSMKMWRRPEGVITLLIPPRLATLIFMLVFRFMFVGDGDGEIGEGDDGP